MEIFFSTLMASLMHFCISISLRTSVERENPVFHADIFELKYSKVLVAVIELIEKNGFVDLFFF